MNVAKFRCPDCGFEEDIDVPENKCLQFHKCKGCGKLITTPKGSCCIICSFSDRKCPVSKRRRYYNWVEKKVR